VEIFLGVHPYSDIVGTAENKGGIQYLGPTTGIHNSRSNIFPKYLSILKGSLPISLANEVKSGDLNNSCMNSLESLHWIEEDILVS
jgi:hypothetical protein